MREASLRSLSLHIAGKKNIRVREEFIFSVWFCIVGEKTSIEHSTP
jgi:hypothetical protein